MKKFILTLCFCILCISDFAQGTVNFSNLDAGLAAKVTDTDGVTGLAGSAWEADLFWAPGVVTDSTLLVGLNQPTTFSTNPLEAGYFFGGVRTILTHPDVPVTVQVRVWDTASGGSWAATAVTPGARVGESILFQMTLADPNGGGSPQSPPSMIGLNGHPWSVSIVSAPEPSVLALIGLGSCATLGRRSLRPPKKRSAFTTCGS